MLTNNGKKWDLDQLFKNRTWCEVSGAVSLDSNVMFDVVC